MLFAKVVHGFAVSILRITRAFLGFAIIGATPSLLSFPVDTALNKKKFYNRRTALEDGWNGGWLRKQQTPETRPIIAGDLRRTCAELARNLQEEGFTGGLPARNSRMFRMAACYAPAHGVSRAAIVDNLWITCG